jgi:hypothetical protein
MLGVLIPFLFIHELDVGLDELVGLIDCCSIHCISALYSLFGLFLVKCDFVKEVDRMVGLYAYLSPLFRIVRHLELLNFAAEDGIRHRLQTIQLLHYLFSRSILHAYATF